MSAQTLWLVGALSWMVGEEPSDSEVAAALDQGIRVLLTLQESYQPDRGVGQVPDDQLAAWQEQERQRLQDLREQGGPGVEWPYEGVYRVDRLIPAGYRVGGSAIVCESLMRAPGFADDEGRQAAVARSLEFLLGALEGDEQLAPGPKTGYDVRGWAHTYALRLILLQLRTDWLGGQTRERLEAMVRHLLHCLAVNEVKAGGGWNYAGNSTSPFMTGSTLLALYQAKDQGYEVPAELVTRALDGLEAARDGTGAFVYSGSLDAGRGSSRAALPGSAARSAAAELCLFRAGRSSVERLRAAVAAFFDHWDELERRKSRQGTHEGPYGIAPYYFFYGHVYAARAIEHLPETERPDWRRRLREVLWRTREADGTWNDRIFPRSAAYSTAMAMLALTAPDEEEVPAWR